LNSSKLNAELNIKKKTVSKQRKIGLLKNSWPDRWKRNGNGWRRRSRGWRRKIGGGKKGLGGSVAGGEVPER
jgi:hypothetical protein